MNLRAYRTACVLAVIGMMLVANMGVAAAAQFDLSSKAAILMEAHGGRVLYEYNADKPLPMASVTKIMTLVIALEELNAGRISPDDLVTTSEHAKSMGGTQIWLEVGEQMKVQELLYAIAVGSANDAAVALAEYIGGSEPGFVQMMNDKARELGMKNTVFANASGLTPSEIGLGDAPHHSSARDLAILSRYALQLPGFLKLVSTHRYTMRKETTGEPELISYNNLLDRVLESGRRYGYPGMDGIKTGMTSEAGYCLAATAKRENLRLIAVVLGAPGKKARSRDVTALLDWGFRTYTGKLLAKKGDTVGTVTISRSRREKVPLTVSEDLVAVVQRGQEEKVKHKAALNKDLVAPLPAGARVGKLIAVVEGEEVAAVNLVTVDNVERGNILIEIVRRTKRLLKNLLP